MLELEVLLTLSYSIFASAFIIQLIPSYAISLLHILNPASNYCQIT